MDYVDFLLIQLSSSPAGVGMYFVQKKDKMLCPCFDSWELNEVTVKYHYPLPVISSSFELQQGTKVFINLNLRNAYHPIYLQAAMNIQSYRSA